MTDTKYLSIILGPITTEKSENEKNSKNKYTFKVIPNATKLEIKEAIEKIFKVKVASISTINVKPKKKRVGRYGGYTNKYKKAIITLKDGQTLDLG